MAFNNHPGSTKSYDYVREHNEAVNRLDFMPKREPSPHYKPGGVIEVTQHDGSRLRLRKLAAGYDPGDRWTRTNTPPGRGEVVTGLLYVDPSAATSTTTSTRSRSRSTGSPRPSCARVRTVLAAINAELT